MQKRTLITVLCGLGLSLSVLGNMASTSEYNSLEDEYNKSKKVFIEKELRYKEELKILKELLCDEKSTIEAREQRIIALIKANKEFKIAYEQVKTLKKDLEELKEQIEIYDARITKEDMPDLQDTRKITNIDINVINEKFKNGVLKNQGQLMVNLAKEYNISPHFFIALIALESNYGKSSLAKNKNNFGGIKSSKGGYRKFENVESGLQYIADLINRKYHSQGRVTIDQIQKRYAPSWDSASNASWGTKIRSIMKQIHIEAIS